MGGFSVGALENLACFEVFDGGDGVTGDEGGGCGFADEEATGSGGDAGEGEEIDGFGDGVLGRLDSLEELDVLGEVVEEELFVFGEAGALGFGFLF